MGTNKPAHLLVLRVTVEGLLVNTSGEELKVSTTAVKLLLVLQAVLKDEGLALVAELFVVSRDGVETVVLSSLQTWTLIRSANPSIFRKY